MNPTNIIHAASFGATNAGFPKWQDAIAVYLLRTVGGFSFKRIAAELDVGGDPDSQRIWVLKVFNSVSVAKCQGDTTMILALRIAAERME